MSEPNYHTTKLFTVILLAIGMKKTQIQINTDTNKPVYLGLSIQVVSRILIMSLV